MAFQSNIADLTPRRQKYKQSVALLSGGYVSPSAFPDGKITVYPWDSVIDEWFLNRIKKPPRWGIFHDLLPQIADLNGCPVKDFLVGDMNTVLLVSRAIIYRNWISFETACPACGVRSKEQINVPGELGRKGEKQAGYLGYDTIALPDSKDQVAIRPLQIKDEIFIADRDDEARKSISDRILSLIIPIVAINDGRPDKLDDLLQWYLALSPFDSTFLEERQNELYPHLETKLPYTCDECGKQYIHVLDVTNEVFFRAGGASASGTAVPPNV